MIILKSARPSSFVIKAKVAHYRFKRVDAHGSVEHRISHFIKKNVPNSSIASFFCSRKQQDPKECIQLHSRLPSKFVHLSISCSMVSEMKQSLDIHSINGGNWTRCFSSYIVRLGFISRCRFVAACCTSSFLLKLWIIFRLAAAGF
jgi:hypothetical protein